MKHLNHPELMAAVVLLLSINTIGFAAQKSQMTVSPQLPTIPQQRFVLTDYNAVGDGKTSNTDAFRKAIAACHAAGGGNLIVPAGTFITGPFELTDNMALVLEKGATIRGSEEFKDYENTDESGGKDNRFSKARVPALPLIRGLNLTNVEISGEGTIDGAGAIWWQRFRADRAAGAPQEGQPALPGQPTAHPRPKLVWLIGCKKVHIQGVTLKNSPQFHLVPNRCQDVTIEDVKIIAPEDAPNTDAIDPTSSRNVLVRRCFIDVGDDNVSFKSNPSEGPLENVLVTDCTFKHGHGASVGSNIGGGIRNITVQHCSFEGTDNAIRIKSRRDRGGVVENITYRDITMKNVGIAILINLFYFDEAGAKEHKARPVTATTPMVRNVRIINVTVEGAKRAGEIIGLPEAPVTNALLDNVSIKATSGMTIQDANAVELRDVRIMPQKGEPLTVTDAEVKTTRGRTKAGSQP
jgi:polygalacturonase